MDELAKQVFATLVKQPKLGVLVLTSPTEDEGDWDYATESLHHTEVLQIHDPVGLLALELVPSPNILSISFS